MRRQIYCAALALACSMTGWGSAFAPAFAMCDPRFGACDYPSESKPAAETAPAAKHRAVQVRAKQAHAKPMPRPRPLDIAAIAEPDPEPIGPATAFAPVAAPLPIAPPATAMSVPAKPATTMRSKARIPAALTFSLAVTPQSIREVLSPHSACLLERAFNDVLVPLAVEASLREPAERRIAASDGALPGGRFQRAE